MSRRPPRSTRTDTLFPYTTLFRSVLIWVIRFADASIRVTGIDRPSSVNTRLIPHLRPTMPIVMVLASVQLDLDVNASRQLELHQRVKGFVVGVDNVQHALVRAGLVLVERFFVDEIGRASCRDCVCEYV